MQLTNELLDKIDTQYIQVLIDVLEKNILDEATAKTITQKYIDLAPYASYEELKNKINTFTQTYPQFERLMKFVNENEEATRTKEVVSKMFDFIKQNQVDEAIQVVKKP